MGSVAQLGVVNCGVGDNPNLGLEGCPFDWGRVVALEFTPLGFSYGEDDLAYMQEQTQKGNIVLLTGIKSFVLTDAQPNINTDDGSGLQQVMGEVPPMYTVTVSNGYNAWREQRKLNSKMAYNVAAYDVNGNKIFMQAKNGRQKGFTAYMIHTGDYKGNEGNNPATYTMMIQFYSVEEKELGTWITSENLDYTVGVNGDLGGVNTLNITLNPLSSGGSTITGFIKLQDKSHAPTGIELDNLKFQKNGVNITPSLFSYTDTTGAFSATVSTISAGTYTLQSWDSAMLVPIILKDPLFFKSNIATAIV